MFTKSLPLDLIAVMDDSTAVVLVLPFAIFHLMGVSILMWVWLILYKLCFDLCITACDKSPSDSWNDTDDDRLSNSPDNIIQTEKNVEQV